MTSRIALVAALSLVAVHCAPAPSGNDAAVDARATTDAAPQDSGTTQGDSGTMQGDGGVTTASLVGTWIYTSGSNEQRINFLGDGRYETTASFTSSSSGCVSSTNYFGRYTVMDNQLSGTAASATTETTDCMDSSMNRPSMDISDAMQIARGNLDGTFTINGNTLTRMFDSSGTPTTREYQRSM